METTLNLFKWKHYEAEIILLTVRWYLRYRLSYRDSTEMMEERGQTGNLIALRELALREIADDVDGRLESWERKKFL